MSDALANSLFAKAEFHLDRPNQPTEYQGWDGFHSPLFVEWLWKKGAHKKAIAVACVNLDGISIEKQGFVRFITSVWHFLTWPISKLWSTLVGNTTEEVLNLRVGFNIPLSSIRMSLSSDPSTSYLVEHLNEAMLHTVGTVVGLSRLMATKRMDFVTSAAFAVVLETDPTGS